jgi:pyruvate,water dikinase
VTLAGLPASPGVAEGPARVVGGVEDLADVAPGEVLVAATTSPAFTPAFSRIAAVVTDRGGLLCHAAIVARELGIPAVVGAAGASTRITTGERVRVDGTSGTVTVLP